MCKAREKICATSDEGICSRATMPPGVFRDCRFPQRRCCWRARNKVFLAEIWGYLLPFVIMGDLEHSTFPTPKIRNVLSSSHPASKIKRGKLSRENEVSWLIVRPLSFYLHKGR